MELLAARNGMIPMTPHVGHMNYDAVPSVVYTHPEVSHTLPRTAILDRIGQDHESS